MRALQITIPIICLLFSCGGPAESTSSIQNSGIEVVLPTEVSESISEVVAQSDSLENQVNKMEEEIDELLKDIK